jgi:hypothetical protein
MQLRLNTLPNTRKSYARVIRAFMRGELTIDSGRTLAYMLNGMLQYWRLESDLRVEERLDAIEDMLREQKEDTRL